jgi:CRP-like cAMP-binding protein
MISPETLRRYPLFASLSAEQLKKIAMITKEENIDKGLAVFNEGQPALFFYVLMEGAVDLFSMVGDVQSGKAKETLVGEINPGEPFGISALIEPYTLTATARATVQCKILKMAAEDVRNIINTDDSLSCIFMQNIAKAAMRRLEYARIQLASARV